ncbi:FAD-dependent oxidoreductase [Paracoccus aestuariivivens]|uniref:Pyridine nucleotide-disulfide oxidoreductase n=1 Tax=Paracoccus aestuariivivens TaxID=1820333 RepID=A0A6L6JBU3_9RHOB|nr:pyridine nucleotide-disulfide oxidoreductase [Paracoccus aestuariivivens]
MSVGHVVIVGAGQGGFQAAASLRTEGHGGPITLIGAEPGLPYQRPPLSKAYLKSGEEEALQLRPASFFEKNCIDLMPETRIEGIDRTAARITACGRNIAYDHLVLATGTRNLRPPIPGLERALDLRTLADARKLRDALPGKRRVAVIGGGFIGLEFAAVARRLGHEVTVAEAAPRLMSRAVSPEISTRFLAMHRGLGVDIRLGSAVTEVTDEGIALTDGAFVDADLVLLAAGVVPNIELATEAGLATANGVVTDARLLTSDPAISALGDCAVFPLTGSGRLVRLESVQAATDHARTIAKRLVGDREVAYTAVPWFWSDQADWKLQIAGLADPSDESVSRDDGAVLRFADGVLTAVETVNDAKAHMQARKLLAGGASARRDSLAERDYDLAMV